MYLTQTGTTKTMLNRTIHNIIIVGCGRYAGCNRLPHNITTVLHHRNTNVYMVS